MNANELDYDISVCYQCRKCKHLEECYRTNIQRVLRDIYAYECYICYCDCCNDFESIFDPSFELIEALDDDDLPY